jgi:hypothetical protein
VVVSPSHHDLGAVLAQIRTQVDGDIEVEEGLGVAGRGLRARGVAAFVFPAVPDQVVQVSRVRVVQAIVTWVDADDLARQRRRIVLARERVRLGLGAAGWLAGSGLWFAAGVLGADAVGCPTTAQPATGLTAAKVAQAASIQRPSGRRTTDHRTADFTRAG